MYLIAIILLIIIFVAGILRFHLHDEIEPTMKREHPDYTGWRGFPFEIKDSIRILNVIRNSDSIVKEERIYLKFYFYLIVIVQVVFMIFILLMLLFPDEIFI